MAVTAIIGSGRQTFYQMIQGIGATTSLDFCLDAAALGSYDGTSQTWVDLTGNGNSFFRGVDGSAGADDPTFNGVAGALTASEYFSVDGGDYFNESAAHTFADAWHHDNAAFTVAGVAFAPDAIGAAIFNNTGTGGPHQGVYVSLGGTTNMLLNLTVTNGAGGNALGASNNFGAGLVGTVIFFAVAIDESVGTDGLTFQINSTRVKATSTYTSPASGSPTAATAISGFSNGFAKSGSGVRHYCEAGWSRRLSDTELDNLYTRLKRRYSTLP